MKEQIRSNGESLTSQPFHSTLRVERGIFMPEPGNGEGQLGNAKPEIKQIESTSIMPTKDSPFTRSPDGIKEQPLKDFAVNLEADLEKNPINNWSIGEIKERYLNLHRIEMWIVNFAPTEEGNRISAESQPYRDFLSKEYESKGGDQFELFEEAVRVAQTPSIGAATGGFTDEILKDIVENELYPQIARLGEGNPIEPEELMAQIQRIWKLKDEGSVDKEEANMLLTSLNELRNESMVGSDVARRRRESREQGDREHDWMTRIGRRLESITDSNLNGIKSRVNSFLREPFSSEKYDILNREIINFSAPEGVSGADLQMFNFQKNSLLEILSNGAGGPTVSENERLRISVEAVELASIVKSGSNERYEKIDELIASKNSNDQTYGMFVESTIQNLADHIEELKSQGVEVNDIDKKMIATTEYLLEVATERILSRADVDPKSQYPQFGFYENINLDSIISMSRIFDHGLNRKEGNRGTTFKYLSNLRQRRQIMHELFRNMKDVETYRGYITQYLRKDGLAFVEKEIAGVAEAQIIYEKFTGSALSFKDGTLMAGDHEVIDEDVIGFMNGSKNKKIFKKAIRDDEGHIIENRDLRGWELDRAAIVGRSLFSGMQRRLVYTVSGDVPMDDIPTLIDSVESEQLARILAPMKLLGERFLGIDTTTRKMFLKELVDWTKELAKRNKKVGTQFGYLKKVDERGNYDEKGRAKMQGLYNKKEDSWAILDTEITDPKSSGWKGDKIFLRQKDYFTETLDGENMPLGIYLDQLEKQITKQQKGQSEEVINDKYQEKVKVVLQEQRLFLGPLLKIGRERFNEANKALIWNKVSELIPSRIAAFFPDEALKIVEDNMAALTRDQEQKSDEGGELIPSPAQSNDLPSAPIPDDHAPAPVSSEDLPSTETQIPNTAQEVWEGIRNKLFLAESMRVMHDAEVTKGKTWDEIRKIGDIDETKKLRDLEFYLDEVKCSDEEKRIIKEITELGKDKAPELAKIKFPYTPFLDDVPKTDYENIEDSSYDRHLVTDSNDFFQGYMAIFGLWAKPGVQINDVVEAFDTAVQKIQGPLGLTRETGAQRVVQKYISTYLSMADENTLSKIFGIGTEWIRSPRSKMEEGNLQAKIFFNADTKSGILQGLAQRDAISDDPNELDEKGMTQMQRMKKDHKADGWAKLVYWLQIIFSLLGPEVTVQIARTLLPREAAEQVVAGF